MVEPHRVLVVDDEQVVREIYRAFFARQPEFEVCAEAADGAAAVSRYAGTRPDLVLMDMQMPVLSGVGATEQICRRWPAACVVAMTTFAGSDYVVAALRAGASGYLLKDVGGPGLLAGLRQALDGDMPLAPAVRHALVGSVLADRKPRSAGATAAPDRPPGATPDFDPADVSEREREVLAWLAQGLSNMQIGARLHLSEGSVKQHLNQLGKKLDISSRTGILIRAVRLGLVDPYALPPDHDPT